MFALLFYVTLFFLFVTLLSCAVYVSRFNDACRAEHIAKSQRDMWIGRHERLSASYDKRTLTISELKEDRADLRQLLKNMREELDGYRRAEESEAASANVRIANLSRDPDIDDKEIEKLKADVDTLIESASKWAKHLNKQNKYIAALETAAQNDAELRKKLRSEVKSLKEKIGIANAL